MKFKPLPPLERVREILNYDPDSGVFTWKVRRAANAMPGQIAGVVNGNRYRYISIDNAKYLAHRLAWLHFYGVDPLDLDIDHKDRDSLNNSIENLRLATDQQNLWNTAKRSDSSSPYKGVHFQKRIKRWIAAIKHDGRKCHIGSYATAEEAAKAYQEKSLELRGSFARWE